MLESAKPMSQPALKWEDRVFDPTPFLRANVTIPKVAHQTSLGALYAGDCLQVLRVIEDGVIDTVFADPPFNLRKKYGKSTDDDLPQSEYLSWCEDWLRESVRILKPGGSLFLYNLPKWNVLLGAYLTGLQMQFRHWIAVEIPMSMPIQKRLHPSHYSLLYYTKGDPRTFRRIRTPIQTCRHCGGEIKDYGGHRNAMNPRGVTLKDVWTDIPPVRHWKFKSKQRTANALSTKLLDRVVEISTAPGDIVVDPFGGSGTTFAVCEDKHRHWIGMEIDFAPQIIERLESNEIHRHKNTDYIEE